MDFLEAQILATYKFPCFPVKSSYYGNSAHKPILGAWSRSFQHSGWYTTKFSWWDMAGHIRILPKNTPDQFAKFRLNSLQGLDSYPLDVLHYMHYGGIWLLPYTTLHETLSKGIYAFMLETTLPWGASIPVWLRLIWPSSPHPSMSLKSIPPAYIWGHTLPQHPQCLSRVQSAWKRVCGVMGITSMESEEAYIGNGSS